MTPNISIFKKASDTKNGKDIPLDLFLQYVKDGKWQDLVLPIRTMPKKERDEAKKKVPYVTLSGTFGERKDDSIKQHSGFIGIDIDEQDPEEIKSLLAPDDYVYSVFTSISGLGACAIFKIDGAKHRDIFAGISEYLYENYKLIIDPTSVNQSRARFISFDPNIWINESAKKFTRLPKSKPPKKIEKIIFAQNDFEDILNEIVRRRLNLCENYHDWLRIGFAICDKFGEYGRQYYHIVSQYSSKYKPEQTDRQYNNCLKAHGQKQATIATFYYYCKQAGLSLYSTQTKIIAQAAHHAKKGGRTAAQAAENIKKFENIDAEISEPIIAQVFDNNVEINADTSPIEELEQWIKHNYDFKRNEITRYIENNNVIMKQKDFNTVFIGAKKVFDKLTYDILERLINSDFTPNYNPFIDFIEKYKHRHPTGQIDKLFSTLKTSDNTYAKYLGKKWIVGIISALHGIHSPLMLVLSGEIQGTGKTEFLRRLLPTELKPYYAESKLDAGKDDEILMTQKLLIMDDEMGGKSKAESKRLKELTSKQTFSLREPYGRNNVDLNRLAVLCGTTNDKQILNDPTGNRRILPIHVFEIDHKGYNEIDKIDVFIEAFHLYKNGFEWQLTKQDIKDLSIHGDEFQSYTIEYELINKYYEIPDNVFFDTMTATEIKVELERNSMQKLSIDRIGKELQRIGYKQVIKKHDGKTKRVYEIVRLQPVTSNYQNGVTNEKPFG